MLVEIQHDLCAPLCFLPATCYWCPCTSPNLCMLQFLPLPLPLPSWCLRSLLQAMSIPPNPRAIAEPLQLCKKKKDSSRPNVHVRP